MLNISEKSISPKVDRSKYRSLRVFEQRETRDRKHRRRLPMVLLFIILAVMLLPWTQNIRSRGYVTSLQPEKRPQSIQSMIAGRIEKWYVQEGDYVEKGDTILRISEIKDKYFDPRLIERTEKQISAKEASVKSYKEKAEALKSQIAALRDNRALKLQQAANKLKQARLKVVADSIDLEAARTNLSIASAQIDRQQKLYDQGLKSKTELEARKLKYQQAQAKVISLESKLLSSRNEVINAEVQINSVEAEYRDKLSKAASERFATLSSQFNSEAEVTKLENELSNYQIRSGFYFIVAPQNGYVTKAVRTGLGETVKEGEQIVTVMPAQNELAVEMYIRPINVPLVNVGQDIRIQFDGWPAIFFSGWPAVSTGTYSGEVVAIDRFAGANGMYRALVRPNPDEAPWPEELRVGGGAQSFALLNNVPIYYEIWRQINGFPPDYYKPQAKPEVMKKKKKK